MSFDRKNCQTWKWAEEMTVNFECWAMDPPGAKGPYTNYIISD